MQHEILHLALYKHSNSTLEDNNFHMFDLRWLGFCMMIKNTPLIITHEE